MDAALFHGDPTETHHPTLESISSHARSLATLPSAPDFQGLSHRGTVMPHVDFEGQVDCGCEVVSL